MSEINSENTITITAEATQVNPEAAYPNSKATVGLFFVFLLISLIIFIPQTIILTNTPQEFTIVKTIVRILSYVVTFLLNINYALKKSKKQQGYSLTINFNKIQGWLIPVVIIAAMAIIIPASQTSAWIPMPVFLQKLFERTFTKEPSFFFMAIVAAPILEEILCRGIILKGLLKNYSPYKAILISAIFFSVMHLNPWQSIPAFFYGLFLGWIYFKTQSVIPGMIFHATLNTLMCLFMYLPDNLRDLPTLFGENYYLVVLLVLLLIFAAMCMIIHKKARAIPGALLKRELSSTH